MTNPFQSAPTATATANPFQQPNGGNTPAGNPFMQPSSGGKKFFPALDALRERLIILRPIKVEMVLKAADRAKFPGEEEERVTADLVVLDGGPLFNTVTEENEELPGVYEGMWINQVSLVGQLKGGLRKGQPILGRLYRFPQKKALADFPTRQDIEAGFAKWLAAGAPMGKNPPFTWKLEQYTAEELEAAMKWLEAHPDFLQ